MSVTAEQYQRPSHTLNIPAVDLHTIQSREVAQDLMSRAGSRLGVTRLARHWHSVYLRLNPWGQGGRIDRTLERLAFFE